MQLIGLGISSSITRLPPFRGDSAETNVTCSFIKSPTPYKGFRIVTKRPAYDALPRDCVLYGLRRQAPRLQRSLNHECLGFAFTLAHHQGVAFPHAGLSTAISPSLRICADRCGKTALEIQNDPATRDDVVLCARAQRGVQVRIAREEITYLSPQANETK